MDSDNGGSGGDDDIEITDLAANPATFNPSTGTTFSFNASDSARVTLLIFDEYNNEIRKVVENQPYGSGYQSIPLAE